MDERIKYLLRCASLVLEAHTIKLTHVLDANQSCVPIKNEIAICKLDRAFSELGYDYEEIIYGEGRRA